MPTNRETLAIYLDLIAAKARALAEDVRRGRDWPGDVAEGISTIIETAHKASGEAGRR